jgi:S1-C subfamily serine protease
LGALLYVSDIADSTQYQAFKSALDSYTNQALLAEPSETAELTPPSLPLPPEMTEEAEPESTGADVMQNTVDAVVSIETDAGQAGSGFFVAPGCMVITNAHVIRNATVIVLKNTKKKLFTAEILGKDIGRDLALLKTTVKHESSTAF